MACHEITIKCFFDFINHDNRLQGNSVTFPAVITLDCRASLNSDTQPALSHLKSVPRPHHNKAIIRIRSNDKQTNTERTLIVSDEDTPRLNSLVPQKLYETQPGGTTISMEYRVPFPVSLFLLFTRATRLRKNVYVKREPPE